MILSHSAFSSLLRLVVELVLGVSEGFVLFIVCGGVFHNSGACSGLSCVGSSEGGPVEATPTTPTGGTPAKEMVGDDRGGRF